MEILPQPQKYRVVPKQEHLRPVVEYFVQAGRCDDAMALVKFWWTDGVCTDCEMGVRVRTLVRVRAGGFNLLR